MVTLSLYEELNARLRVPSEIFSVEINVSNSNFA
jgi:hypothetical protein